MIIFTSTEIFMKRVVRHWFAKSRRIDSIFKGSKKKKEFMCDRKNINLWATGIRGDVSLCSDNLLREISMNRKLRIGSETTGVEK